MGFQLANVLVLGRWSGGQGRPGGSHIPRWIETDVKAAPIPLVGQGLLVRRCPAAWWPGCLIKAFLDC
jgi:hypothetical protein